MQRLISLFGGAEQEEGRLSKPPAGPPPGGPDYGREPEYFEHLLAYLREQRTEKRELARDHSEVAA